MDEKTIDYIYNPQTGGSGLKILSYLKNHSPIISTTQTGNQKDASTFLKLTPSLVIPTMFFSHLQVDPYEEPQTFLPENTHKVINEDIFQTLVKISNVFVEDNEEDTNNIINKEEETINNNNHKEETKENNFTNKKHHTRKSYHTKNEKKTKKNLPKII